MLEQCRGHHQSPSVSFCNDRLASKARGTVYHPGSHVAGAPTPSSKTGSASSNRGFPAAASPAANPPQTPSPLLLIPLLLRHADPPHPLRRRRQRLRVRHEPELGQEAQRHLEPGQLALRHAADFRHPRRRVPAVLERLGRDAQRGEREPVCGARRHGQRGRGVCRLPMRRVGARGGGGGAVRGCGGMGIRVGATAVGGGAGGRCARTREAADVQTRGQVGGDAQGAVGVQAAQVGGQWHRRHRLGDEAAGQRGLLAVHGRVGRRSVRGVCRGVRGGRFGGVRATLRGTGRWRLVRG